MVRPLVLAVAFLSFTLSALAQLGSQASSSPPHNHPGLAPTQQIDGSVHPEQISDSTAYRLFFLTAGKASDAKDQTKEGLRQFAHLRQIALSDQDNKALIAILDDFRSQFSAMVKQYNQYAETMAASGENADSASFIVQRDQLVQATRDKIAKLSFDAQSRIDTHIQNEKKNMKSVLPTLVASH